MKLIADLEIHSRYSRATSKALELENIALWAAYKGIDVVGTGDFTHPIWFESIKEKLEPAEPGLFKLKELYRPKQAEKLKERFEKVRFMLSAEVSCIYSKGGKVRKVHHLLYAPDLKTADKINTQLSWIGNLKADGRPILGLASKELLKIVIDSSASAMLIPAHVWTPHFAVFGSKSGYNSLEECFEELTPQVPAIETGLSSDPKMNWRLSWLAEKAIVSFSDAHSLPKLGREATVFNTEPSYAGIRDAIVNRDPEKLISTIEFFPEEGKYHYDGHRKCEVRFTPQETAQHKGRCPKCGTLITRGVLARVEELSDKPEAYKPANARPFVRIIPLMEIIAESLGVGTQSKQVMDTYLEMVQSMGGEFEILLEKPIKEIKDAIDERLAEAIERVREEKVKINPGYDGVFGEIRIFDEDELDQTQTQQSLF